MNLDDINIRSDLRPGDLGFVMYRHGKLYGDEYDYGIGFETYVGAGLHEFYKNYDPQMDRVWICEYKDQSVGFMLLMHSERSAARLRFFYIEPDYRGIGLGKKLMDLFMKFLYEKDYKSAYLWTTEEQINAISLYKKYGFVLTEEKVSNTFGKPLKEQRYDLNSE